MTLNSKLKIFVNLIVFVFVFNIKTIVAKVIYDSPDTIISASGNSLGELQYSSRKNQFLLNADGYLFVRQDLTYSTDIRFYASGDLVSDRFHDDSYKIIDEFYVGINNDDYGNLYIGRTPTVYYNGFSGGWLDYKLVKNKYDSLDSTYYGDFFTTKVASNSIFYTYKFSNFKISLQASARNSKLVESKDNDKIRLNRDYGAGLGLGYGYGPIQFGVSYINIKLDDTQNNKTVYTQLGTIGAKVDAFGLYSAIGIFYDTNRWYIGNQSYSFQYLIQYDRYTLFDKKIVPQLIYSYKHYNNIDSTNKSSVIANNDIYLSIIYSIEKDVDIFIETKIDMRANSEIEKIKSITANKKYLKYNRLGTGIKISV